jgi:hypothetical protein
MKDLRLEMNALTFDQLVELGRSAIPTLAPAWTDHNGHDPGIMLMELVAWITEAQMYSIARTRRDERRAYARLLGVEAHGPLPARGLLWPFAGSGMKGEPAMSWSARRKIDPETPAQSDRPDTPVLYTSCAVQLTTARLVRVETQFADGTRHDWTRANIQDRATFMPFGDAPAAGDRLVLTFTLAQNDSPSGTTPIALGFDVTNEEPKIALPSPAARLRVSLSDASGQRPIELADETTAGLLKAGVLLLRIDRIEPRADNTFTLTLRSITGGFERPPRVRRVGLNVIPMTGLHTAFDNPGQLFGNGRPDQRYELKEPGLMYPVGNTFEVKILESGNWQKWTRVDDLALSKPDDRNFELDVLRSTLVFGNGVNGKLVPAGAAIQVKYQVCNGSRSNLPAGVRWNIFGLAGDFGTNRSATTGGQDAQDLAALRAVARVRSRASHPLVTAEDLRIAALSFVDLGVKRAIEVDPSALPLKPRGSRTLVVVGPHDDDEIASTESSGEAQEFLESVRSRLAPNIPLGERLEVIGPIYVPVRITATLVAVRNADPKAVQSNAALELRRRLEEWPFGRDVTQTAIKGWLRKVEGVARVVEVTVTGADDKPEKTVTIKPLQLPKLAVEAQDITVNRQDEARTR